MSSDTAPLHICLFEPLIPQNTGNIARLAAATRCVLHLVEPLGFELSEKRVKRAGLDYWPFVQLKIHSSLEDVLTLGQAAFISKFGTKNYTDIPSDVKLIVFGKETTGLPSWVHDKYPEDRYQIPMFHPGVRSLNLANAVAIVTYDYLQRHVIGKQSGYDFNGSTQKNY